MICAEMLVGFKLISEWRYEVRGSFPAEIVVFGTASSDLSLEVVVDDKDDDDDAGGSDDVAAAAAAAVAVAAVGVIIEFVELVSSCRTRRSVTVVIVIVSTT